MKTRSRELARVYIVSAPRDLIGHAPNGKMASDLISNPAYLSNVLSMLSANSTETIRNGEKMLKPALKNPQFLLSLMTQLRESPVPEIRHHAALLMKKKLYANFKKLTDNNKHYLKVQLLACIRSETIKATSVSIAGCLAMLAKASFSIGVQWPELFATITEFASSPLEPLRSLNYSILEQLSEHVSEELKPHTPTLVQMFIAGCEDPSLSVATASIHAIAAYISSLSGTAPEALLFKTVLTPVLNLLQKCLQQGEELIVAEGLDVFQECVIMKQPVINDHIEYIVPFIANILQNESYDPPVKKAAGQTLICIMESRPKLVAKKNMVAPTLTALASIIGQSSESSAGNLFNFAEGTSHLDDDKDDEDEEVDMQRLAQTCIDIMAVNVPSKYFVEPALAISAQGMQSADPRMRKAGCAILGIISEGCADPIRKALSAIVPHVVVAASDAEKAVREVAYFALGQFSEYCQPEILTFHSVILPVLLTALDDPQYTVQTTACYVLEMFCENLQRETLRPFLEPLLSKLAQLLQSPKKIAQVMALSAISGVALAAERDFVPYLQTLCSILRTKLFTTEPADIEMRGRALECLGHLAISVGCEQFEPYFELGVQSAQQGIAMDNDELKEYAYVYFANTSKAMKKKFSPMLPTLMPHLLEIITQSEYIFGGVDDEENEDDPASGDGTNDVAAADPDYDPDDDDGEIKINGVDGFVNTKKTAITAVQSIAQHCEEDFGPYIAQTLAALLNDQGGPAMSYHDIIRAETFDSLQHIATAACACRGITGPPPHYGTITLPEDVLAVVQTCLRVCIEAIKEDEDKYVVSKAYESVSGIITRLGVVCLSITAEDGEQFGQKLINVLQLTLSQKLTCQEVTLEQGEDEDAEDHDNLVMDDATDTISAIAKAMGPTFIPLFDSLLPLLLRFGGIDRSHSDRAMTVGTLAEVLAEIGPQAEKYKNLVFDMAGAGVVDEMETIRRNSAFCFATLVESVGRSLTPDYFRILQALYPLCQRREEQQKYDSGGADIDNALSAVAKMIKVAPEVLPLEQVLPVMLAALPLRSDMSEGPSVYGALTQLLSSQNPVAMNQLPGILTVFSHVLEPDSKDIYESKVLVCSCLKAVATNPSQSPTLQAALQSLSDPATVSYITSAINS